MRNAEALRQWGVHVTDRALLNEAQLMLQDRLDAGIDNHGAVRAIFQQELNRPEHTLVMSHEAYAGISYIHPDSIAPFFAESLAEQLQGQEVEIVVYLRRQDLFMESRYVQSVKSGLTITFAEYLKLHGGNHLDWHHLVTAYAGAFGKNNVIVRVYDRQELKERDIVADFLDIVAAPPECFGRDRGLRPAP